jgi:transposase
MFELNIATLPNSILYMEGMQLSYIKVYVHIFNLWHSHNSCFISNAEFARRTGLHRDTVINAIQFFEKNGILKRVQKGTKRYLVQATKFIETTEEEPVDNSEKNCTNSDRESELDQGGVGVRPPRGSELDHHNNKLNTKSKKSSCADAQKKPRSDWKAQNETVHPFAESKNQMANEAKHIEQHEAIKRAPMPESLRSLVKNISRRC